MLAKHSYDVRGRQFSKALYWSETSAFGPRAYFVTISKPAALSVDNIQLDDEGVSLYSFFYLFCFLSLLSSIFGTECSVAQIPKARTKFLILGGEISGAALLCS